MSKLQKLTRTWLRWAAEMEDRHGQPIAAGLAADVGFIEQERMMSDWCAPPKPMSEPVARIWDLLYPYIASENGPDYDETNMEILCAGDLPKAWEVVLELEAKLSKMEAWREMALYHIRDMPVEDGVSEAFVIWPEHSELLEEALAGESDE